MSEILEIGMLICFGFSWPLNVAKAIKVKTAKGKSLWFLILIIVGYIFGIISKLINPHGYKWYVMFFYVLNISMVSADLVMYFINRKRDKLAAASK